MNDMAIALEKAGANVKLAHLNLRSFTFDVLRKSAMDVDRATCQLEAEIGNRLGLPDGSREPWLRELCKSYVCECLRDMDKEIANAAMIGGAVAAPRLPTLRRNEDCVPATVRHRAAIKKITAAVSKSLFSTIKTGDGRLWSETEAGDLLRFDTDGKLAHMLWDRYVQKLSEANPHVLRWPLKDIITAEQFEECWRECR